MLGKTLSLYSLLCKPKKKKKNELKTIHQTTAMMNKASISFVCFSLKLTCCVSIVWLLLSTYQLKANNKFINIDYILSLRSLNTRDTVQLN